MNYYAFDPIPGGCKQGDIVLVEELDKKMTRDITHKILRIVYPLGDMIDPVTGKRIVRTMYREDKERINKLWGENPDYKFDYHKAPRRGWQEGKKDWTHKKPYRKFHEFTDRDQTEAEW
jgi:small subunit ribosomal protein S17